MNIYIYNYEIKRHNMIGATNNSNKRQLNICEIICGSLPIQVWKQADCFLGLDSRNGIIHFSIQFRQELTRE
jgi:predicted metalloprotease